jgi:enolase-phosphatase E1
MSPERLYLLDVEGTVAPLTLTTEVLFPYARKRLREFLIQNIDDLKVHKDLILLAEENKSEGDPTSPRITGAPGLEFETWESTTADQAIAGILAYLLWLMDRDRKSTALKSLQGKIWKAGFESGELKGTVFDDVPPALARWAACGKVAIYSSGSVDAQKLFFQHSSAGDMTPLISGYFDTRTGVKTERASYSAIAASMRIAPGEALFFSDSLKELDAARVAGLGTRLVVRPGNPAVDEMHGHAMITRFDDVH